jgi:hypothetical protein
MTCYRIYMLNRNGLVLTGSDETCENDEAAVAWARTTVGDDARAEIWQDARCVGHISGAAVLSGTPAPHSSATPGRRLELPLNAAAASSRKHVAA